SGADSIAARAPLTIGLRSAAAASFDQRSAPRTSNIETPCVRGSSDRQSCAYGSKPPQASGGFPGPSGGRERLSGSALLSGGRLMPRQSVIRYGKWPPLSPRRGTPGLAQVGGSPKRAIPGAQSLKPLTSPVAHRPMSIRIMRRYAPATQAQGGAPPPKVAELGRAGARIQRFILVSQPHPRVEGFAFLADLEIELRAGTAAAVPGLGDGLAGGDVLADRLVEAGVVAIEAHVAAPVINDDEKAEPRQPVRVYHPALGYRAHGRGALRREEIALPSQAAGAHLSIALDDFARHRPGQLAAQLSKRRMAQILGRKARGRPAQLRQQGLQVALLLSQAREPLGAGLGLRGDARQNLLAMRARLLQGRDLDLLLLLQPRELGVLRLQLIVELPDALQVRLDGLDLGRARAAEVAVIDEHPPRLGRITLIQQEFQRLLPSD